MLTTTELNLLENGYFFGKDNFVGKGVGGCVYKINTTCVVKLVPNMGTKTINKPFNKELEATIILSHNNISPRVLYHSKISEKFTYYVMEKLDHTLMYMLDNYSFTEKHLIKLVYLLKRLNKTQYRHNDLHLNNIMWSDKHNDFRLIDWGIYYITKTTMTKQSPYLINRLLKYVKKNYIFYNLCIFTFINFKNIKSEYKKVNTNRPHYGVRCNVSNELPITGKRYHLIGRNYDLNEASFNLLPENKKVLYEVLLCQGENAHDMRLAKKWTK